MQTRAERIRHLLQEAFMPIRLEVVDESARHAGHAGARPEGETHFRIIIISKKLQSLSRVEAHRKIHTALAEEFSTGLHALAIEMKAE